MHLRLRLNDQVDQILQEDIRCRREQMEYVSEANQLGDPFIFPQSELRGIDQQLWICDDAKVIQQLVADLDLEIIGQELKEASEAFEPRNRKTFRICKVHKNRAQARLQKLPRQATLVGQNHLQTIVRDILDVWGRRIKRLEINAGDSEEQMLFNFNFFG
jgi:hypothetical protein